MAFRVYLLGVLTLFVWVCSPLPATAATVPTKSGPRRVARVTPSNGKVRAQSPNRAVPNLAYYEVIEHSQGAEISEGERSGPGSIALDATYTQTTVGSNCAASTVVQSEAVVITTFTSAQTGPVTVRHPITVVWHPGKEKKPEPEKGLTIHFHHFSRTLAMVTGIGIKGFIGSARAKAKAQTQGPGGETKSVSENSTSLGTDTELDAESKTFSVSNLKSGWKGYLTVTVAASASSVLVGSAEAEAEAEITWEAEVMK